MNRTILVTGAGGLIGSNAVEALHGKGYQVTALYRSIGEKDAQFPWRIVRGDLLEENALRSLRAIDFDSIVHCAAVLPTQFQGEDADRASQLNLRMDEEIVRLCSEKNSQLVYLSGTAVYGFGDGSVLTEEADLSPIGPYAQAKARSEKKMLSELRERSTILRVSAPYGPRQRARTVLRVFMERALAGHDLLYYGSGKRQQDFTAAYDVGKAILSAVSHTNVKGIFNIASGNPISIRDLGELVVRTLFSRSRVLPSGQPDPQEDYRAAFDISKARKMLGWYPTVSLENGIRQWADHLRRNII